MVNTSVKMRPPWRPEAPQQQSVYLLCAENGRYKIGRSGSLAYRLSAMEMSPVPVSCVHVIHSHTGVLLEQYLHHMLMAYRVHGEWFELPSAVVETIRSVDQLEVRKANGDWLKFVERLNSHLPTGDNNSVSTTLPEYITAPEAARVVGVNERTMQLWVKPYVDQRTLAGYPISLLAKVAHEHGSRATENDFALRKLSEQPARKNWNSEAPEVRAIPQDGEMAVFQRIERLLIESKEHNEQAESLARQQIVLTQTVVDYLARIDSLLSERRPRGRPRTGESA